MLHNWLNTLAILRAQARLRQRDPDLVHIGMARERLDEEIQILQTLKDRTSDGDEYADLDEQDAQKRHA